MADNLAISLGTAEVNPETAPPMHIASIFAGRDEICGSGEVETFQKLDLPGVIKIMSGNAENEIKYRLVTAMSWFWKVERRECFYC